MSTIQRILLAAGYYVVRALASTYRFRYAGNVRSPEVPCYILAIWHRNLFAGILAQTGRSHVVMISRSRDGDAVTTLCRRLGHHVARGSSRKRDVDKGGQVAMGEMIDLLQQGLPGALTVDGPRGPAEVVKAGIVEMARVTGLPIVPYLALPTRYWTFPSWDAFRLPKPFSRIDVHYGAPLRVPTDTPFEAFADFQQRIGASIDELERKHGPQCAGDAAPGPFAGAGDSGSRRQLGDPDADIHRR
jgi:lysophospholipid acyltransferase (LPLAT)-like uncharacterized protein